MIVDLMVFILGFVLGGVIIYVICTIIELKRDRKEILKRWQELIGMPLETRLDIVIAAREKEFVGRLTKILKDVEDDIK